MRVMILCVIMVAAGCVSEETKQLAQGISLYQAEQSEKVGKVLKAAHEKGIVDDEQLKLMLEGQKALVSATNTLSEVLGRPKNTVEVDSW